MPHEYQGIAAVNTIFCRKCYQFSLIVLLYAPLLDKETSGLRLKQPLKIRSMS